MNQDKNCPDTVCSQLGEKDVVLNGVESLCEVQDCMIVNRESAGDSLPMKSSKSKVLGKVITLVHGNLKVSLMKTVICPCVPTRLQ